MTEIKELIPRGNPRPVTPQCEGQRSETYSCDEIGKTYQCSRASSIQIDGKFYCRSHAGAVALNMLMKG